MILGISGDSPFCHTAFHKAHPFPFPLLSDVHRSVITAYGVSVVVVDSAGAERTARVCEAAGYKKG